MTYSLYSLFLFSLLSSGNEASLLLGCNYDMYIRREYQQSFNLWLMGYTYSIPSYLDQSWYYILLSLFEVCCGL